MNVLCDIRWYKSKVKYFLQVVENGDIINAVESINLNDEEVGESKENTADLPG